MNKIKDTDLREALHRKYAETPKLPADFMTKMEEKLEQGNHGDRSRDSKHKQNHGPVPMIPRWRWIAAAASLLLLIGIGVTLMPSGEEGKSGGLIAQHTKTMPQAEMSEVRSQQFDSPKPADSQSEASGLTVRSQRTETNKTVPDQTEAIKEETSSVLDADPNLHYAAHTEEQKDTLPYQDPARMDEFIAKMASYYNVKEGELTCSSVKDSNVVSAVYVFPDKKMASSSQQEVDVFNRLLQAACWYNNETPGYFLNFSHQQFFFELKDMHHQLHYRWIAERVNGKILLYGTHAPLGTKESSTCYQEYRDELMHIKSINNKTRKI